MRREYHMALYDGETFVGQGTERFSTDDVGNLDQGNIDFFDPLREPGADQPTDLPGLQVIGGHWVASFHAWPDADPIRFWWVAPRIGRGVPLGTRTHFQ